MDIEQKLMNSTAANMTSESFWVVVNFVFCFVVLKLNLKVDKNSKEECRFYNGKFPFMSDENENRIGLALKGFQLRANKVAGVI